MVVFQAVRIAALQCMHAVTHLPTPVVSTADVPLWLGSFLEEPEVPFCLSQEGLATLLCD